MSNDFADIRQIVSKVPDAQVMSDLDASVAWAKEQGADLVVRPLTEDIDVHHPIADLIKQFKIYLDFPVTFVTGIQPQRACRKGYLLPGRLPLPF